MHRKDCGNQTRFAIQSIRQGGRQLNTKLTLTLFAAVLVAGISQTAVAQESGGGIVAVLDVAKVFEQNQNFISQMDGIKSEAENLKAQIQAKQVQIQEDAQAVMALELGSPERNQQETAIEQRQAALRTQARQLEMDLLTREAKIYYSTYQQLKQVVGALAEKHNIGLVMRFDSTPIDPENRAEVIKGVNRTVVFHDHLDLTGLVVESMGGAAVAGNPPNRK